MPFSEYENLKFENFPINLKSNKINLNSILVPFFDNPIDT